MKDKSKLLSPCPFCGEQPIFDTDMSTYSCGNPKCSICGIMMTEKKWSGRNKINNNYNPQKSKIRNVDGW